MGESKRALDLIIFGATGYTGTFVLREFVRLVNKKHTWGIAGRNKDKMNAILNKVSKSTGDDLSCIPVIVADCDDEESLRNMAKDTKVVINCCGPYRLYGENVVRACIESSTHHVDVSGEPEYMETIQMKYHQLAEEKGVYIISACGFDSVPADFGVLHFLNNFDGLVNSVESYLEAHSCGSFFESEANVGTWESVILGVQNQRNLGELRRKLFSNVKKPNLQPKLKPRPVIHRSSLSDGKFCVPFLGSDKSVVYRTQIYMYKTLKTRPVQYIPYLVCNNVVILIALIMTGMFLKIFSGFSLGRKLLSKYPGFFTFGLVAKGGPSIETVSKSKAIFRFHGSGWTNDVISTVDDKECIAMPLNKTMITEMSFESPGYGFTATSVILCALTILNESDRMPSRGGVYTPGSALSNTSFFESLLQNGVSCKVICTTELSN